MDNFDIVAVEHELEMLRREQERKPSLETKGGCSSLLITLIVGVIIWRLILEIISICV